MRKLIAAAALLMCAVGSAHAGCYIANYDANGIPNEVCTNNTSGGGAPAYVDKWTAIAVSKSTLTAGSAHGQNSMNAAQQLSPGKLQQREVRLPASGMGQEHLPGIRDQP